MPIDAGTEAAVTLYQAAALLPGRPHVSTLWRWVLKGCRGVRLETIVCGGRRYTSREALSRFIAATTARAHGEPTHVRTPRQRQRDIARAEAELAQAGIG